MHQQSIQFTTLARKTDPATSIEAARRMEKSGKSAFQRRLILDCLECHGPLTAKEIGRLLNLSNTEVSRRSGERSRIRQALPVWGSKAGRVSDVGVAGMKVLVACEYSGTVRDAFIAMGHDAISCDLLPTESPGPHHQGDVMEIINDGFDLMIAHPPCTHLAVSGARHFEAKKASGVQDEALAFVRSLLNADIPKIALENPISIISSRIRKPDQIIQLGSSGMVKQKEPVFG